MIKYSLPIAFFILVNCIGESNRSKFLPIDPNELIYKKGDCLSFQIDNLNKGVAIVIDHSKDEGGLWYGLCFTNYFDTIQPKFSDIEEFKVFGRKIESSINKNGFFIGLDLEFINDSCLKLNNLKFKLIGNVKFINEKMIMGAEGATKDYSEMLFTFQNGLEKRTLPPDDYRAQNKLNKFRPEEYFQFKDFIIKE
jgi:hypothetical protein